MSFSDTLKSLVGKVAPTLGAAIGGPFGGIAGTMIQNALGVDSQDLALEKLQSDPDALLKIKALDNDFKVKMGELGIKEKDLENQDRSSARNMAIKTTLLPQIILATIYVIGFMMVLYVVFTGSLELTADQKDIAMYLLGILSAGLLQIMNFFFGSSSGSKEKDVMKKAA